MSIAWWFRTAARERANESRHASLIRTAKSVAWWAGCIVVPLVLRTRDAAAAEAVELLLSVDVLLTMALAASVVLRARSISAQRNSTQWLWPRHREPALVRWMFRIRWVRLAQWPAGLALAAGLLTVGNSLAASGRAELLLSTFVGLCVGCSAAFALRAPSHKPGSVARRASLFPARGIGAISRAPFRQVRGYLDLRRLTLLAAPAMLAAPVGASVSNVGTGLVLWLPMICLVLVAREAVAVDQGMRRWLGHAPVSAARVSFYAWRHVVMLFMFMLATGLLLLDVNR